MFSSFFLHPWMLIGLTAILIPPLLHLLNRRRYEVVDWGAMQFLQVSETTRRRLFLEELLLMLVRMGLIAVLVLALSGPFLTSSVLARLGPRTNRDVVLVFDGSYSMGSTSAEGVPHEKAKEWASAFVADLAPGDTVAILQAKDQVVQVLPEPSHDLASVQERIDNLPPPSGGCDWRQALQAAAAILSRSQRAEREIVLLSDGQRFGWADRDSLFRWSLLASELGLNQQEPPAGQVRPRFWVVNVAPLRDADPPNWSLTPLESNRPLVPVEREVTFRTAMDLHGQKAYSPPHCMRLEIDGRFARHLAVPNAAALRNGRVPFSFTHRFATAGSHLVSVVLEPDPPPEERPANYTVKDELPGDNRQDFAVEVVPALPVLIVEGEPTSGAKSDRDFLRDALAPAREPTPVVRVRVIPVSEFDPALLAAPEASKSARPRVLILRDVARLTTAQQEAVGQFLTDGGSVLVTLGPRVEVDYYNGQLYRAGKGWLPAHLDGMEGDVTKPENAAHPAPGSSDHPALQLFLEKPKDGKEAGRFPQLGKARFPRWWKLSTPGRNSVGVQVAALRSASTECPFLVEWVDPTRAGRLLVCAVPLDDSWDTNVIKTEAFVPLAHELVYYLAGARSTEFNLEPGQPLRYRLVSVGTLEQHKLRTPRGETKPLSTDPARKDAFLAAVDRLPQGSVLRIEGTRETGVYQLQTAEGGTVYYVVRPKKAEESDLTPCSDEDRAKVAELLPGMKYPNDRGQLSGEWISESHRQELWWWLLLGLIALLCGEVWLTGRIVKNR
ncbi:MAG TPA: VWA domain-containing protein [Gemmataceae bacterium]|jgi:hypothetical protein